MDQTSAKIRQPVIWGVSTPRCPPGHLKEAWHLEVDCPLSEIRSLFQKADT